MGAILWLKFKRMRTDVPLYAIMVLMALLLSFIFGTAMFDGGTQRVYVVDDDQSAFSQAFAEAIETGAYELSYAEAEEAQRAVEKGQAIAALMLPTGFGQAAQNGEAALTILRTVDSPDVMALESTLHGAYRQAAHAGRLHSALSEALGSAGLEAPTLEDVDKALSTRDAAPAITTEYTVAENGRFDETFASNIHFIMGFNIFFVMFSIVFTMGGLLEDKKLRTFGRIRISPISSAAVLAGHFVPAYIVGLAQMGIVLFVGQLLFGFNLGESLLPIFGVFAAFVLTAVCIGLLLATTLRNIDQMGAVTPVIVVSTSMLGGCMWPLSIVGPELRAVANGMPQKWALEAVENIAIYGSSFGDVLPNIGVLLGMALVLFGASVVLYNKKQRA